MKTKQPAEKPWPEFVESWVLPFVRESRLWPILFAILGHTSMVLTPLMLEVVRRASPPALAALFVLAMLSTAAVVREVRVYRTPGAMSALVALVWLAGAIMAYVFGSAGFI